MFGHVYGKGVEAKLNLKREQVQGCERGVVYGKHTLRRSAAHAAPQYAAACRAAAETDDNTGRAPVHGGHFTKYFELFFLIVWLSFVIMISTICVCLLQMTQG